MKSLAVIPARSGSKGVKDKNIRLLNGKPLLWYSVESARKSGLFEEIMVSTDSKEYAKIARECGAKVPFLRSAENSNDKASSWDMIREVLLSYRELGMEFDTVCILQPTSPLRTVEDIRNAYELYEKKNATTVSAVCEAEHSPLWSNTLDKTLSMDQFMRTSSSNRHYIETYYRINGAIYITRPDHVLAGNDVYMNSYAYIMSQEKSVDIDTELDFEIAELIMKHLNI